MVSYLATATLLASLSASPAQPPEWQADYGKALEATRDEHQPLLVVLDDPDDEEAQVEPALLGEGQPPQRETELLEPYNLCHVDVSTDYGKRVAEAFRANDFPYTAIIDKSGSVILFAKAGKIDGQQWREVLAKYRDGERADAQTDSQGQQHVTYKVSKDSYQSPATVMPSPSYCPSCQRR